MHRDGTRRQVRRYTEKWTPEILDTYAAEMLLKSARHLVVLEPREERERVVIYGGRLHKRAAQPLSYLSIIPFHRDSRTNNCSHAAAPDPVDRHMRLTQGSNDAEMGKTTRPTCTQDEPDRSASQEPQEAGNVVWIAVANLTDDVYRQARTPALNGLPDIPPFLLEHDEVKRPAAILTFFREPCGHREWRAGGRDEQHAVGLAQAELGPVRICGLSAVDNQFVASLCGTEPFGRAICRFTIEQQRSLAVSHQSIDEIMRDATMIRIVVRRDQGHRPNLSLLIKMARGIA